MTIEYLPGKLNHVADALSPRPDCYPNCPRCSMKLTKVQPTGGGADVSVDPLSAVILVNTTTISTETNLLTAIKEAYTDDDREKTEKLLTMSAKRRSNCGPQWRMSKGLI